MWPLFLRDRFTQHIFTQYLIRTSQWPESECTDVSEQTWPMPTCVLGQERENTPKSWRAGGPDRGWHLKVVTWTLDVDSGPRSEFQLTISSFLFINTQPSPASLVSALFTRLLALALLQISSLSALLCHSGLCSNVCPSERTFLLILAIVSSKLSLSHHPVSHSWSINILLPRLVFVSSTMTFGKACPDSSRPWEMWGLRMWVVLPEALLPSLSLFLSRTGLVFHQLLHQNMQSPILWTSLCSY